MYRKTILIGIIAVFMAFSAWAQSENEINNRSSLRDRLYFGGGLGLDFGVVTYVQIAPVVGYRITNEFSAGVGVQYVYLKDKRYNPDLEMNNYGTSIFARYNIRVPFFAQVEFEYLNYELLNDDLSTYRKGFSSVLVGGGISQPIGRNASFNLIALYNLAYKPGNINGPYDSPLVIRAGINLGF